MKFTDERVILGKSGKILEKEHLGRYEFAQKYIKNKKVLDIGCGTGYGTSLLSETADEVIGVDISGEAIDYARKHYKKENIIFYKGDATNLNFLKDEKFDVIVSFETIEHISNYHQYLKEMFLLLKKDGIFIVSTPNKKYSSPNSEQPLSPFHVIEFQADDFKILLGQYFSSIELYGQDLQTNLLNRIVKIIKKIIPKKIRQIIPQAIKAGLITGIVDKNIENCRYFIAVCRK